MDNDLSQVARFVGPENLDQALQKIIVNACVTSGSHDMTVPGYVNDLEWNAMDQLHRNFVHDTYHGALPVGMGKDFLVSITPFRRWPIFIPVVNLRLSHTLHHQLFVVLGLIYCHIIVHFIQQGDSVLIRMEWRTLSHRWLRPLQGLFNRRLLGLIKKQQAEDLAIRSRRLELRRKGFRFTTDVPDYLNSNMLTDNIIPPMSGASCQAPLAGIKEQEVREVQLSSLGFHVKRDGSEYVVWPALCPHEGARMTATDLRRGVMHCPWHGRCFTGIRLPRNGRTSFRFANLQISLQGDSLILEP